MSVAPNIYRKRQQALRSKLQRAGLEAVIVSHIPNVRYVSGFSGSSGVLVVTSKQSAFFTDGRYIEQAREQVTADELHSQGALLAKSAAWASRAVKGAVGCDESHLTVKEWQVIKSTRQRGLRLRDASGMVEGLRVIKDADEIEKIRAAVELGSKLFESIRDRIRPGVRETDIAAEIEYAARKGGAEGMSFETIVAGGARSALPHGVASQRLLPARGFVVLDFGVILSGYCSDMTRTVHLGKPDTRARRLYQSVLRAQQSAIRAVRPQVTAHAVDQAARGVLHKAGLGEFFTHSTGHGVGLEIHEAPRLARKGREKLKPGMVVTIEPGAYIPGAGGVRIEDMVVVTQGGCEVLTPTTKELIVI